ncbi:MAG: UDP-2,3-diacylglucosamine diphosphatase LpxI [bacterium]
MGYSGTEILGLLAGTGRLPVMVAEAAARAGHRVYTFGFQGMMSPELYRVSEEVNEFPFCRLAPIMSRMEEKGISRVVTIGAITQMSFLSGTPRFDDLALEIWKRLEDRRVDTVMGELVKELTAHDIQVVEALRFLQDHLVSAGVLTGREPSEPEWEDVRFGFAMAKAIGGLDIGQTVVVKHRAVMAVEAVEGTDRAILRGGRIAGKRAVVAKVAKPGQDMRFDVPAAGVETIESMKEVSASALALEAGKVLLVDREDVISRAEEAGICIIGLTEKEAGESVL